MEKLICLKLGKSAPKYKNSDIDRISWFQQIFYAEFLLAVYSLTF